MRSLMLVFAFAAQVPSISPYVLPSTQVLTSKTEMTLHSTTEANLDEELDAIAMNSINEQQLTVFSSSTRLLAERRYAKRGPYMPKKINTTPTILDLSPPRKLTNSDPARSWLSFQYRGSVIVTSYFAFPYILQLLARAIPDTDSDALNQVVSSFVPGISILFGTLCSLTVNILYQRQARLQQTVSEEASLLSQITQDVLHLLRKSEHEVHRVKAAQGCADYVATLVGDSRGTEVMKVAISDPVSVLTESVTVYEQFCEKRNQDLQSAGALVGSLRSNLSMIGMLRARRLSDEALALPPTHYGLLGILSGLILAAFLLSSLGSVDAVTGIADPSVESRILFSVITGVYLLFFNFSRDLNQPFEGVYQIRRSQTASSLLKTKRIITSAGLADAVDFGYSSDGDRTT